MSKTKIISFCIASKTLRSAIKTEGLDGPVSSEVKGWGEIRDGLTEYAKEPNPSELCDLGSSFLSENISNFDGHGFSTPVAYVLPISDLTDAVIRAEFISGLEAHTQDSDYKGATAYAWDGAKLTKVFPSED